MCRYTRKDACLIDGVSRLSRLYLKQPDYYFPIIKRRRALQLAET